MNAQCYRVIFNKARGMLMVVSGPHALKVKPVILARVAAQSVRLQAARKRPLKLRATIKVVS